MAGGNTADDGWVILYVRICYCRVGKLAVNVRTNSSETRELWFENTLFVVAPFSGLSFFTDDLSDYSKVGTRRICPCLVWFYGGSPVRFCVKQLYHSPVYHLSVSGTSYSTLFFHLHCFMHECRTGLLRMTFFAFRWDHGLAGRRYVIG